MIPEIYWLALESKRGHCDAGGLGPSLVDGDPAFLIELGNVDGFFRLDAREVGLT